MSKDAGGAPPKILYEMAAPHVARVTLNRPEQRNAQDTELLYALNAALDRAAADDEVRVIVIDANGPDFSSGHDLREAGGNPEGIAANMYNQSPVGTWAGFREVGAAGQLAREQELYVGLCERWRALPKPTIVAVQGRVIAGGLMLVWPFDIVIASDDASFQDNTVAMGICGAELFAHPTELGIRKAKEMLFTSDSLTAEEAHRLGMVNRIVPRAHLLDDAIAMASRIAAKSLWALRITKEVLNLAEDAMGRATILKSAVGYHHLSHAHWRAVSGVPVDPEFIRASAVARKGGLAGHIKESI